MGVVGALSNPARSAVARHAQACGDQAVAWRREERAFPRRAGSHSPLWSGERSVHAYVQDAFETLDDRRTLRAESVLARLTLLRRPISICRIIHSSPKTTPARTSSKKIASRRSTRHNTVIEGTSYSMRARRGIPARRKINYQSIRFCTYARTDPLHFSKFPQQDVARTPAPWLSPPSSGQA